MKRWIWGSQLLTVAHGCSRLLSVALGCSRRKWQGNYREWKPLIVINLKKLPHARQLKGRRIVSSNKKLLILVVSTQNIKKNTKKRSKTQRGIASWHNFEQKVLKCEVLERFCDGYSYHEGLRSWYFGEVWGPFLKLLVYHFWPTRAKVDETLDLRLSTALSCSQLLSAALSCSHRLS